LIAPRDDEEGLSAAHKSFRLLLLPSGPDKVHGVLLRRTQTMPNEAIKGRYKTTLYYMLFVNLCQFNFGLSRQFTLSVF